MLGLSKELILSLVCVGAIFTNAKANAAVEQKPLKILVPLKLGLGFQEFVAWERIPPQNNLSFSGFCVDVFRRCLEKLPFKLHYEFVGFGDGVSDPSYDAMVQKLVNKEADGIVADITITEDRMRLVDFTQPYIQSSLVMLVPFHYAGAQQLWSFLQPFGAELWASIVAVFVTTGVVIFVLESENPLFHGEDLDWRTCIANVFWFTSMTLFFCQRNDHEISSRLGRVLTVVWLMVVLIFTSTYTASLTSILSAQRPSPTIQNYDDLWKSNLPVGYQNGSFVEKYIENSLRIRPSRLVALVKEEDYATALELGPGKKGGVAAILEESPYVHSFLNSECKYTTSGNEIAYFGGFGFAFQKNSSLTDDISLAIISLSKNRELQNIKDSYLGSGKCIKASEGTFIPIENFVGLFIVIGVTYGLCVILKLLGWILVAFNKRRNVSRSLRQVGIGAIEIQMHPVQEEADVSAISSLQSNEQEEQKKIEHGGRGS